MNHRGQHGFTMAEALIVIGITVVLAAAAIPGGFGAWRNIKQLHLNRCAETIFMTAQRNLAAAKVSNYSITRSEVSGSSDTEATVVLPANTVSPSLYNGHWVVQYSSDYRVQRVYYWEDELSNYRSELGNTGKVGQYGS